MTDGRDGRQENTLRKTQDIVISNSRELKKTNDVSDGALHALYFEFAVNI